MASALPIKQEDEAETTAISSAKFSGMAPPAMKNEDVGFDEGRTSRVTAAQATSRAHQQRGIGEGSGLPPLPQAPLPSATASSGVHLPPGQSLLAGVEWSPIVVEGRETLKAKNTKKVPSPPDLSTKSTDTTDGMEISLDDVLGLGTPDSGALPEPVPVGSTTGIAAAQTVGVNSYSSGLVGAATTMSVQNTSFDGAAKSSAKKSQPAKNSGAAAGNAATPSSVTSMVPTASTLAAPKGGASGDRRQRRLERNRESARLSRRRRKQYLEELEEKVTSLSEQMDAGRREHVSQALGIIRQLRTDRLREVERDLGLDLARQLNLASPEGFSRGQFDSNGTFQSDKAANPVALQQHMQAFDTYLSRTSDELRIAATFQKQQILSLALPQYIKLILWLTIQNETFYRGGRAASERLSAARIGERMIQCGTDRAPPSGDMWPLLCNDVGLSYDQEEKIRSYQRKLLLENEPWLHRHHAAAADASIEASANAINAAAEMVQRKERSLHSILTLEQRGKFEAWAALRKERIERVARAKMAQREMNANAKSPFDSGLEFSPERCDAANLYIVNDRLQRVCRALPTAPALIRPASLKKLARRASFESLGSSMASLEAGGKKSGMSKEKSFPSSGYLKRSASSMSMDDESTKQKDGPTPEAAEKAAEALVLSALNDVRGVIPSSAPRQFINICPPQPARGKPPSQRQSYGQQPHQIPVPPQQKFIHQGGYLPPNQQSPSPLHALPQQVGSTTGFSPASPTSPLGMPLSASNSPTPLVVPSSSGVNMPVEPMEQDPLQQRTVPAVASAPQLGAAELPTEHPGSFVQTNHGRVPSLLPPHMNIAPEDGFLNNVAGSGDGTDDFIFDILEADWAIGEGFDDM